MMRGSFAPWGSGGMRWPGTLLASAVLALACLILALGLRGPLTASMSLHMLVQIPLLVLAGLFAEQAWQAWRAVRTGQGASDRQDGRPHDGIAHDGRALDGGSLNGRPLGGRPNGGRPSGGWSYNEYGMPGLLLVSLVGAGWMIPKALDDALTDWRVAAFKYLGLPVCGWILRASLRRSNVIIKLFFLGNFCWMSAIVGMVYLDQPIRLCNAYLQDDQDWAGRGLIALAIVLPSCWLLAELKPVWRFLNR